MTSSKKYNREVKVRVFPVCLFCPISPNRMLVLNYMNNDLIFKQDKDIIRNLSYPPQPYDYRIKSLKLAVKKVYQNEVEEINEIIYDNAKEGVIINSNDIQKSIYW